VCFVRIRRWFARDLHTLPFLTTAFDVVIGAGGFTDDNIETTNEDLRIRNYAPSTVECYVREVAEFAKHFGRSPEHLGPEEIRWGNVKTVEAATHTFRTKTLQQFAKIAE